jgi:hypothetical protein
VNQLYTNGVGTKISLANRYLRNPEVRERTVMRSVATSSAIEGIRAPFGRGAKTGASRKIHLKREALATDFSVRAMTSEKTLVIGS